MKIRNELKFSKKTTLTLAEFISSVAERTKKLALPLIENKLV